MRAMTYIRKLPGNRIVYFVQVADKVRLDRYERWMGDGSFLESFLEPWRGMTFASVGQATSFVTDLVIDGQLV